MLLLIIIFFFLLFSVNLYEYSKILLHEDRTLAECSLMNKHVLVIINIRY